MRKEQESRRREQETKRREKGGSRKDTRQPGSRTVCRDLLSGWCSYGSAFRHFHPERVDREKQMDGGAGEGEKVTGEGCLFFFGGGG